MNTLHILKSIQCGKHRFLSNSIPNNLLLIRFGTNHALEAIKNKGMRDFEKCTQETILNSRKSLRISSLITPINSLTNTMKSRNEKHHDDGINEDGPSIRQLRKAKQLLQLLDEILDGEAMISATTLAQSSANLNAFYIAGEPIEFTRVEVSPDLRHARVYWTLPHSLMGAPEKIVRLATKHMQNKFVDQGGRVFKQVIGKKLRRSRFIPSLRFVAENTLLTHTDVVVNSRTQSIEELDDDYV